MDAHTKRLAHLRAETLWWERWGPQAAAALAKFKAATADPYRRCAAAKAHAEREASIVRADIQLRYERTMEAIGKARCDKLEAAEERLQREIAAAWRECKEAVQWDIEAAESA